MSASSAADIVTRYIGQMRHQENYARQAVGPWAQSLIDLEIEQALTGTWIEEGPGFPAPPTAAALRREVQYISKDAAVRRLWQKNRVVYDLDPDLWAELGHTDAATTLPGGILRALPHPDPFIALPTPLITPLQDGQIATCQGFFVTGRAQPRPGDAGAIQVSTHAMNHTGRLMLLFVGEVSSASGKPVMLPGTGNRDSVMTRVTLDVADDQDVTVGSLVDAIASRFDKAWYSAGKFEDTVPPMIMKAVSALIYLCATNAELRPLPASLGRRKPAQKGAAKPPQVIAVGYQIGAALKAWRRSEATERASGGGRSVRPHIRRAHFHTFRVGAGRIDSIVKWLSPIPINATGKDADKPTIVGVS